MAGLVTVMQRAGVWRGYQDQVVGLEPILFDMSERGMPIDATMFVEVKRQLTEEMDKAKLDMVALVPRELRKVHTYKKRPKKFTPNHYEEGGVWYRLEPWSPSNQALLAYMRFKGHPVPKDYKSKKETTNQIEVKRLSRSTKDPMYARVIDYRKAQTILKNHIKNWEPGGDGRVHGTFYYIPATGQLSSKRPNVQNAPKHDDPEFGSGNAKLFRSMIVATPGHTLVELDFKSFHAQTLAFEAEDADYLRLAKLDIHSYLTAHLVHDADAGRCLGWDDEKLGAYLKRIKGLHKFVRDYKAKRAILGYGFGMGYVKLYDMNKESFDSQADAKRVLQMLDSVFPITKAWRDRIRQRAHDQGYLVSRFGFIRYFWEVMRWRGGQWSPGGDDSEAAIAFLPANDAFGHMRAVMLEIREKGLDSRYELVNNIHDSLLFNWPNNLLDELPSVVSIMVKASPVLINSICPNGLSVEVDAQAGPNWASLKGI